MLELPESCAIATQMQESLVGKCIANVEVLRSPHRFAFIRGREDNDYGHLEGQKVVGATYHGGMVQLDLEEDQITFADGAYPRYYDAPEQFPKKHQFALFFDDDTALTVSIQMYGEVYIYPQGQCTEPYYLSSSSKPSPLTKDFTFAYFKGLLPDTKKMSAKAFLATEQRIPGLGNGVLQDILWDAGIDPRCPVDETMLKPLYQSVVKVLKQMVQAGGRDTEKKLYGDVGGYVTQLSKNSLFQPCMKCGHEIQKANYMGGTVYFCEKCQRRM